MQLFRLEWGLPINSVSDKGCPTIYGSDLITLKLYKSWTVAIQTWQYRHIFNLISPHNSLAYGIPPTEDVLTTEVVHY